MLRNFIWTVQQHGKRVYKWPMTQQQQHAAATFATKASTAEIYSLEQAHIDEALLLTPTLASVSPEMWHRAHETFANHGLPTRNFLQIVTGNPGILKRAPHKIIESIEHWRSCQFGEKLLHILITKYPELMDISNERILRTHFTYLKSFAGTNKNVWKLLMNSPNLMEQSEECIERKMEYFKTEMRIEVPEIVKSEALSKPLEEIRCRHVFLTRLGLFKPRPLKSDPNEPTKNPRLYKMTDTSEKTFATKVCHVSLAEYEAFKELYQREYQRKMRAEDVDEELSDDEE